IPMSQSGTDRESDESSDFLGAFGEGFTSELEEEGDEFGQSPSLEVEGGEEDSLNANSRRGQQGRGEPCRRRIKITLWPLAFFLIP
ncbi:hypothetical protein PIB30_066028, partial [Stylosanthes scabra]|nr:hypothetical protein [Stylosanthes scabra]